MFITRQFLLFDPVQNDKLYLKILIFNPQTMKILEQFTLVLSILTLLVTLISPQQDESIDRAMRYVQQFQAAMSDMFPTESFTFDLAPGIQTTISIWPQPDIQQVTTAFYFINQQDPTSTAHGLIASCQINGAPTQTFNHQKLAACTFNITFRPSFIKLNFLSQFSPVTVYIQYEMKKIEIQTISTVQATQNIPNQQQAKKNKLSEISKSFQKVKKRTQLQEGALRLLTKSLNKHNSRFEKNLRYAHQRLMIETGLVIGSGLLGLWIMRKQMNNGYEILV